MNEAAYTVTPEDLTAANRLHYLKLFSIRRWAVTFIMSAVALAFVIFGLDGSLAVDWYLVALSSIWAIIVAICIGGWFMIPRHARRSWRQAQKLWTGQRVTWDADKIHFQSQRGDLKVSWGDYHRWAVDDRSLLLYQDDRTFYLVPLRDLPPEAGREMTGHLKNAGVKER